jgi:hypothetical protein
MCITRRLGFLLVLGLPLTFSTGCGGSEENAQPAAAPPVGATKLVGWDPSPDPTVSGYIVYYGTQPRGDSGSCDYHYSEQTSSPSVTLKGLDFNTRYFLSVSAFNGRHSACSEEVSFETAPA